MSNADAGDGGDAAAQPAADVHSQQNLRILVLGALGIVYGDIGTSPLYAFREALFVAASDGSATREDVLGILSLIIWALTLIVTVKYVSFVLRADNKGEGGTLSLMSLAGSSLPARSAAILVLGVLGAALFTGDSMITPAISVLAAVEGLETVTPALEPYVLPVTLVILAGLFAVQRFGTGAIGGVFGPITFAWFLALGVSGVSHIVTNPGVLWAVNPYYAVHYLVANPGLALGTIGAVFLAVTGAEALYVDLGHFGRRPIVMAWLWIVFPCLLLNYIGQGAFVLNRTELPENVFFDMQPRWALVPMVALATAATIIASQAVISGAFSLVRQAVQLNLLPRFSILHTSETQEGQIYLPRVNWLLGIGVMMLVLGFQKSGNLASAYGISVTGQMVVTDLLLFIVMRRIWSWSLTGALMASALFLVVDLVFLGSNVIKVIEGGWVTLTIALVMCLIIWTWVRGGRYLFDKTRRNEIPLDFLAGNLLKKQPHLVSGTAVFLTSDPLSAPTALMHSLKHYKVLHEQNVILSVVTAPQPVVPDSDRVKMETLNELFMRVTLTFGYMEQPNIPRALAICRKQGWKFDIMSTSFFLSRRSLKASPNSGMPVWQDRLFIGLARTAADATEYFQIPTGRVVEIGTQVVV
ncbi:potassium transporter Kup [Mesorhizobium sp. LNJC394B00]|uniref:potassium transporter Kup n=1 Tax=Mesorhizobium sp. LNJC394B00 TaxID=1287274 RepID=UPI0003CF6819|nr:potassium transporter Kup [Mesorhizobium sp. LNJC394B00]ESY23263.1 potassium transporter Kup [Mesorhizobium sp. LNJC394B00]